MASDEKNFNEETAAVEEKAVKRRGGKRKPAEAALEKTAQNEAAAEKKTAIRKSRKNTAEPKASEEKTVTAIVTAEKKTPVRRAKKVTDEPEVTISTYTEALWKTFEAADVSAYDGITVTVQVNVKDMGVFYIALNAKKEQPKEIMPYNYYLADVTIDTAPEEMNKIIKGGYDYIEALKTSRMYAHGVIEKFLIFTEIFK